MSFCYLTTPYRIRPVPDHPRHFADSMGVIWFDKPGTGLVQLKVCPYRYPRVTIDGESIRIHRLVAMAFHGRQPRKTTLCRHLNDVKADNRPENLVWGTDLDNEADYRRLNGRNRSGTSLIGRFKAQDVERAVALIKEGMTYPKIARETGISLRQVYRIRAERCPRIRHQRGRPKLIRGTP